MRPLMIAALSAALASPATAAFARTAPSNSASSCDAHESNLGGIGRALIVGFTGLASGAHVCAVVANLSLDGFTARVADEPPAGALVVAALSGGGGLTLPLEGATLTGAGPWVVAPGGVVPAIDPNGTAERRVVLAYAGGRVLIIATTPAALADLALVLRRQPALFGSDAVERAVLLATGPAAGVALNTADGTFGGSIATAHVLALFKRG